MGGPFLLAGEPRAATSSRSVTKEPFVTPSSSSSNGFRFPKSARILRSADFKNVYEHGFRVPGRYLVAFCLAREERDGPKIGFTAPRSLGKSVVRNRIKRRVRECVRLQLPKLGAQWAVVFNPRRAAYAAPFQELFEDVAKVFRRCSELS